MVTDADDGYLCVSFPFGVLGHSGSFQMNRSAYLMPSNKANVRRTLYFATGNIDSFFSQNAPHQMDKRQSMRNVLLPAILICFVLRSSFAASELPKEVQSFIAKRDDCDHFRGEIPDPSEKRRMKEVIRHLNASCKGTDKALARLRSKYANDERVISRLREYEDEIEPHPEKANPN